MLRKFWLCIIFISAKWISSTIIWIWLRETFSFYFTKGIDVCQSMSRPKTNYYSNHPLISNVTYIFWHWPFVVTMTYIYIHLQSVDHKHTWTKNTDMNIIFLWSIWCSQLPFSPCDGYTLNFRSNIYFLM